MGTGDKSPVTNFGAAKEVKNCRLVILLPADLRVEITAKSKRNGGSHIVANGFRALRSGGKSKHKSWYYY